MTSPSCEEFVARLVSPAADADAELKAHLATCEGCRGAARAVQALQQTAQTPSPETLGHFATRVRAAHLRAVDREARRAPLRTGLFAGLSAVGAAAAVVLVLQLAFPSPGPAPAGSSDEWAAALEPGPAAAAPEDDLFDLAEGAPDLSDEGLLDLLATADDDLLDDFDT